MCDKTKDKQLNIFIDSEKLILKVCSTRQRNRSERERVGRALGM